MERGRGEGGGGCLHWVECEALDGVDGVDAIDELAVALERVLLGLYFRRRVKELDRNASLDRRRGVACEPRVEVSPLAPPARWPTPRHSPWSLGMHLTALVMNLSELSRFCQVPTSAEGSFFSSASARLRTSQIHTARPPMAATILVGDSASEYTLACTGIESAADWVFVGDRWIVESHEAEMTESAQAGAGWGGGSVARAGAGRARW